ncbi:MAG: DUF4178 domain-containing protein [Planctomycetales bacterium]
MKGLEAPCPACAAPVRFTVSSSLVTVCTFCHSVVARGDKRLEDLGKVADLVETDSPLQLDLKGQFQGKRFRLVGRAQYRHAAGGVWDEWYAAFPGNRWGWLAEAQGRFYLTFERPAAADPALPALTELEIDQTVQIPPVGPMKVAEIGRAEALTAAGEIPYRFVPGALHDYADLYGPEDTFATIDQEEDERRLFLGREVTLEELGIPASALGADREPRRISALQVNCPQCAGPLTLQAPDKCERVTCPNCASLLDVNQGTLQYLETLAPGEHHPVIPLGTTGTLGGVEYTVIGFLARSVTFDSQDYFWTEYLLYQPREGFRWLVHSDDHWSFVRPISAGGVSLSASDARWEGRKFRLFQRARATVRHVLGEFYWKVCVGEQVDSADFIAPPDILSIEKTSGGKSDEEGTKPQAREVSYSLGTYLPHAAVEEAFGVRDLKRGFGVAPNQPAPVDRRLYRWWGLFAAVLFGLNLLFNTSLAQGADLGLFFVALLAVSVIPVCALLYGHAFEKSRWQDSQFSPYDS